MFDVLGKPRETAVGGGFVICVWALTSCAAAVKLTRLPLCVGLYRMAGSRKSSKRRVY